MLTVVKRDGATTEFNDDNIARAVTKAFVEVEGESARTSSRVKSIIAEVINEVRRVGSNLESLGVEQIQDLVEVTLMKLEPKVGRAYIIYRQRRSELRGTEPEAKKITYVNALGEHHPVTLQLIKGYLSDCTKGLKNVDAGLIARSTMQNVYDEVKWDDLVSAISITIRPLIEREPEYSYLAARLIAKGLKLSSRAFLKLQDDATYADDLKAALHHGVSIEQIDPKLVDGRFDLNKLGAGIKKDRDGLFDLLGIQTLFDRYFLHDDDNRYERPQVFFMRVAMGLAINEDHPTERALSFYELLSSRDYMTSTPTLFNAGTMRPQLSSCYLTTVPDDLSGIYHAIHDNAMLSKFAGGLGNDWTPVRGLGSYIKGTNGKSQGVVPFLKVVNDTAVAVNQGGKRKGAVCAYLETWHVDIEEFLELRKNTGDDRRRTHDMNTANWIPDLFMKRVFEDGKWTLFTPSEVPDLHDLYGSAFEKRYEHYEQLAAAGKIKLSKVIQAKDLWRKMLSMIFETGHPWFTFKDPCNIRSPQQHVGVVHSSNLCTEITLNTNKDEIAVCNLGSINLVNHIVDGKLDEKKLQKTVHIAVRMLDNVIDINYYAVDAARNSNFKHRPVGLGIMGFQDALYLQGIPYRSDRAVEFADSSMEAISYFAIQASCDLAEERGSYETFDGSLWSQGVLPIDSLKKMVDDRGKKWVEVDTHSTKDWMTIRGRVKKGIRNSNIMAIAPTATIANICGVSQSIEPTYQNLFVKSNLSGEFTVINEYLVNDLKSRGLWDTAMVNDLKYYDGSVQQIERIPQDLKDLYATAFEVDVRYLIDAASRRQKWIDQAQSLNLYIAGANGKKLDTTYRMAWFRGLKTTYYLRALAATSTEKSTIHTGKLNAVSAG
ncbi:ribonucleoside-diphosphate reductase alpha chain [Pseudomonas nitritireducens]|uniref:Ribonucleoside-diphosphate reductase n=1 Tax=Pseudomonas nitroreducens TaxID=46680 RepID=A0A7W7KFU9_PSENT|nr:ribonucleoside-diphosphate reductase alpha chain [Pseudomonas nitritireducens]